MNAFERICLYFVRAWQHFYWSSLAHGAADLLILIFFAKEYWYLAAIILLGDIIRYATHGAWYCTKGHETSKRVNPSKTMNPADLFAGSKLLLAIALVICGMNKLSVIVCLGLYVVVFANTAETMRRILLTMQKHNPKWLEGTNGEIGLANWLSIIRISLSVILPHLFWAEPFGSWSMLIGVILLGESFISDALDGWVARKNNIETRAGRYLDPLGDKVLFIPLGIAFTLMTPRFGLVGNQAYFGPITFGCIVVAIARDILFFVWFFTMRKRTHLSMKAGWADKIRMVLICAWLGAMTLAYVFHSHSFMEGRQLMINASFVLVICVFAASIFSVISDINRMKKMRMMEFYS